MTFTIGDRVTVSENGVYKFRGKIAGTPVGARFHDLSIQGGHNSVQLYDVQPEGKSSMRERVINIHPDNIRLIASQVLAYDRKVPLGAKRIDDYI